MLTRKQLDLLKFIHARVQAEGVPPSFDEMKEALNLRSKSGIHRLIMALEERGFIRRLAHRARAVEVVKLAEGMEAAPAANVIRHDFRAKPEPKVESDTISIPLVGRIAAGVPIEALESNSEQMSLPRSMVGRGEHFALTVKGDSMTGAGILDGDVVVVRKQDHADDGDVVVALVENEEATMKTLRRAGRTIELHAANPAYSTQRYDSRQVRIQGRMVGLIRTC